MRRRQWLPRAQQRFALLVIWSVVSAPLAWAKTPEVTAVAVYPTEVALTARTDRQGIVVQAVFADGVTRDVTAEASYTLASKAVAKLDHATLAPLADGATELTVKFQGRKLVVPVKVTNATVTPPVSFSKDVMPIFTKVGCNTGACHGSSRGKDGFHMSLFGYDPDGDYFRLTREAIGRRINLAVPEESLMLEKATGHVPHTGGERFKRDTEFYDTLLAWLKAGALKDSADAKVVRLEANPRQAVLEGTGAAQQLNVRAFYADGTSRDVTRLTVFMTNNDVAAKVSEAGNVIAGARGEAFITVRFEGCATGVQVLSIPKGLKFTWPQVAENNYIDTLVDAKLKKLRITPTAVCDDATFLRRAYLDVTGTLPTPETVRTFLADKSPGKRDALIDELLGRKEYVDLWVMKWAELLQVRSADQQLQMSTHSAVQYFNWLEDQVTRNVPVNTMVKTLLTATGPSFAAPEANFYKVERDTLKLTENVAQSLMGVRIQCAQCHNHPFDRWTTNDYYSFAAFFAQVGRKPGEDPRETIVFNNASGEVKNPVSGKNAVPKFLGGDQPKLAAGTDRRQVLAEWLTAPDNPYFARNLANIVWAQFFGKGIVDPVDDVRVSNPASNPELLDALAAHLVSYNFDCKRLVRDICLSRTYQLASVRNGTASGVAGQTTGKPEGRTGKGAEDGKTTGPEGPVAEGGRPDVNADEETTNFARAGVRRIRAEVLLDAINEATGSTEKLAGLPLGARAVKIADGRTTTYFLTTFGRATRETPCSCEVKMEPNLSQALHLLNGDTVNGKIASGGLVKKWLKEGRDANAIVEELYLRTLSRPPTAEEMTKLQTYLADAKDREAELNDLFWSLLNAKEFVFNH